MNIHPLYFSLFPQGATVTSRAHGPDVSKYDLRFMPESASAQLDLAIQRVSYRTTRDEAFETLLPGVMSVPIRGGYHYLNSDRGWKEQADKYLSFISGYDYHFHNCDFEDAFNVMSLDFAYWAWQWIRYVEDRTGKPTLLYTSPSLYGKWIAPSQSRFGINWNDVDLWTAQWFFTPNPDGSPTTPAGRTAGWKFWQYTAKADGTLYGLGRSTACDLNVYNGDVAALRAWLGLPTTDPIDPGGEPMTIYKGTVLATTTLQIREGPGTSYVDIGDLHNGDQLEASEILGGWWRLVKVNDQPVTGYSFSNNGAWIRTDAILTEPQPATLKHTIKVYSDGSIQVDDGAIVP